MSADATDLPEALPSAIPAHLRRPRTTPLTCPADHVPMRKAWGATLAASVHQVGIAYFGIQYRGPDGLRAALNRMHALRAAWSGEAAGLPDHHDLAQSALPAPCEELVCIAYWRDPARMRRWLASPSFSQWRREVIGHGARLGFYLELLCPRASDVETLFSERRFEGIAAIANGEPVYGLKEHGYWGSMRDRLPAAQTSALDATGAGLAAETTPTPDGQVVVVRPHGQLAVIRSGQDWTDTTGDERAGYLDTIQPALHTAMRSLERAGPAIGCHANRLLQHVDDEGRRVEKTFGVGHWRSLSCLEQWAAADPEHLKIFGAFIAMARALGTTRLRLYHEVMVLDVDDQYYEYVNCHPRTGLLNGLGLPPAPPPGRAAPG